MATAATTSDAALKAAKEEPPAMPHALMLALRGLDDAGLRREFDKHADKAEGERRMSKAGLASFMRDKGLAHGDADVERAMERVDTNKDGDIDYAEFCSLSQATSDLEKVLQAKHLESILCYYFPKGTTLQDLAKMERAQFSAIVKLSEQTMVQLLVDLAAQVAAVGKAQDGAGGSKFSGELKGGPLDDFYKGVTGVCGEPDADIEKGMREEHTERNDSNLEFSTSNYGITTTPSREWLLVSGGGSGCEDARPASVVTPRAETPGKMPKAKSDRMFGICGRMFHSPRKFNEAPKYMSQSFGPKLGGGSECDAAKVEGKEGSVTVTSTRGCFKDGKTQPDVRVLRPIAYYGDFGNDGRLRWGVGDEVVVGEAFTVERKELAKDTEGTVLEFNAEGAAKIVFREIPDDLWVVPKDQFYRLFPLPNARDTPIQRLVKKGRLRRCDVLALVLYTGVCVYLCGCEPRELMPSLLRVY